MLFALITLRENKWNVNVVLLRKKQYTKIKQIKGEEDAKRILRRKL
jgi:hypothetical protein